MEIQIYEANKDKNIARRTRKNPEDIVHLTPEEILICTNGKSKVDNSYQEFWRKKGIDVIP